MMTLLLCTILGLLVEAILFTLFLRLCLGLYETVDLEVEATPRQDGLGGGLGGGLGRPSAWTLVGSEYYLRHLRTSACGTRARTSPCSSGHFAFFEDSPKAQVEELPTFIFGGSLKQSRQVSGFIKGSSHSWWRPETSEYTAISVNVFLPAHET